MLPLLEIKSKKHVTQNGRDFKLSEEEFSAFLGINILMGIHKLPSIKNYWAIGEGLESLLIQKQMTWTQFMEILRNTHFTDNLPELPS